MKIKTTVSTILILLLVLPGVLAGEVTTKDYQKANGLRAKLSPLALNIVDQSGWIGRSGRFWYRKSVENGFEFLVVDARKKTKKAAFNHQKLAVGLSELLKEEVDADKLPFRSIRFQGKEGTIQFEIRGIRYSCNLITYSCKELGPARRRRFDGWSGWQRGPAPEARSSESKKSKDKKWEAYIKNYNLYIRSLDSKKEYALSQDGSEGNYYTFVSIVWSPDSKKIAAYRLKRGYHRIVHYVESSPADQLQPRHHQMEYAKPGDALDIDHPVLFRIDGRKQVNINDGLFPNPYDLSRLIWHKDSRSFTFEYNQRGHQVYRIIEVDAENGKTRSVISEEPETFFHYSGKKYRFDVGDGREIIWMSERDGWNHLYLYDGLTGRVKNQITRGEWVVRNVDRVDVKKRQIYFRASGMYPGKDPYFVYGYRINFDGSGLTTLTPGDGNHSISYSPDAAYYLDTWSRVDLPPVTELRRLSDRKLIMTVERADISRLAAADWQPPEVFVAKGRDGKTDIWGIIIRPMNFIPKQKYPVVESIYAGPHGSFVPKSFRAYNSMQSLAELGFIVVQIDGMGTSNRSKAFHNVCWKNIKDAGFPDRILWHKAVAEKYPWYDISRVGIYGGSAGGQNTLSGMLFHPEFYEVGVSSCGCHDNRMDKIWWNEQWMGWPLGPEYAASSNVDNAYRLKGKLLLVVGELDTNVDPSSTMQVVNALIKADKTFDLLVVPGGGHGSGGAYGLRKRYDFFVQHLLGQQPPDWNRLEDNK